MGGGVRRFRTRRVPHSSGAFLGDKLESHCLFYRVANDDYYTAAVSCDFRLGLELLPNYCLHAGSQSPGAAGLASSLRAQCFLALR